ncbi:MAG: TolB family protein [Chthoniobacterales bacterium]
MNRPLCFAIALLALPLILNAQQQQPANPPRNRLDKALVTKATPEPKGKVSPNESRNVKQYTIEQFMNTTRVGGSAFTADEQTVLFHSNKSGIFNVYSVPFAGGEPKQLTDSAKESTYIVTAFPTDARFLYRHDVGGNENEHLYLREIDGSERDLTPGEKTKANFLGWSQDRKSFFISRVCVS